MNAFHLFVASAVWEFRTSLQEWCFVRGMIGVVYFPCKDV